MYVNITSSEKEIIKTYLSNPQNYVEEKYLHLLPRTYPDGTKLTRFKPKHDNDQPFRSLIIPQEHFEDAIVIPLSKHLPDDCMAHSCTVIKSKMFFHQNATESTEVYTPPSSSKLSLFGGPLEARTVTESTEVYTPLCSSKLSLFGGPLEARTVTESTEVYTPLCSSKLSLFGSPLKAKTDVGADFWTKKRYF